MAALGAAKRTISPDLHGQPAIVVGILHKWVVRQEELDRQIAEKGWFAHRGPGTFYRLVDVDSGEVAQVQRMSSG